MRRSLVLVVVLLVAGAVQPASAASGALDPAFSHDGIATAFATGSVATAVAIELARRGVVGHVAVMGGAIRLRHDQLRLRKQVCEWLRNILRAPSGAGRFSLTSANFGTGELSTATLALDAPRPGR